MKQSFIRVLGSADWHQTAYNDHSCYTICDKILIDACPSVITQLLEHDVDPLGASAPCASPTCTAITTWGWLRCCTTGAYAGIGIWAS